MVIKPMIRNNICMNAHPSGCELDVKRQIAWVKSQGKISGPKNVLVIGGSAGYGLASRITAAFGAGAKTLSVAFEKASSDKRPATVGWYNTEAFQREAAKAGIPAWSIYGDAFSNEIKQETIDSIKANMGTVDLVIYSLASGVRTDPATGVMYRSALKPIGQVYKSKSVNPISGEMQNVEIAPANDEDILSTVKVMGGEDWELWTDALLKSGVLAPGCKVLAYSYIGPELTRAVYREGTIGKAKEDLEATAGRLDKKLAGIGGRAWVSVNKALVTRASAVIPVVPLYLAILYKIMKRNGTHEGCIEQMYRLFAAFLYKGGAVPVDAEGRIRIDDLEMDPAVQKEVEGIWAKVTQENLEQYADLEGYRSEFLNLHGFGFAEIDYDKEVEI